MADKSYIEWTNTTWNVVTGCTKISEGCKNCYAERYSERLKRMGVKKYKNGFKLTIHKDVLSYPLTLKTSRMIFVNSMSDLFHENIPFSFIKKVFDIMLKADWHIYQILTKRSKRLMEFAEYYGKFPDHVWIGVSVESSKYKYRIDDLKHVKANIHFLSIEPLLERIGTLDLNDIEWVIVGGESGYRFRECKAEWVREIRDQCLEARVPFFFKQWGGITSKARGRILDGKVWNEFPKISRHPAIHKELFTI